MEKDIEDIKQIQVKSTFSKVSKNFYGIFKIISLDYYIKKCERNSKIKKTKIKIIEKPSVSNYLDQICKDKGINFYKENTKTNETESIMNPLYNIHKEEDIDIFSNKFSTPPYIKPNIIQVITNNEKQKKRTESILKKMKNKFHIPPIGKYNINYQFIRKHTPSYCFSHIIYNKKYQLSCHSFRDNNIKKKNLNTVNDNKKTHKRNYSENEKKLFINSNYNFWKQNYQTKPIKKNNQRHKSEIIINENNNDFFITIMNRKKKTNKHIICKSVSNDKNNKNINKNHNYYSPTDFFIKKIKLIDMKKKSMNKLFVNKYKHISYNNSSQSFSKKNTKTNTFISPFKTQNI